MTVVVRFAPSPTGFLHIGGARTALFNWLFARNSGGRYLLRIEDTDRARSTAQAVSAIMDGLDWLGLGGDEPPVFQHTRLARHAEVAQELLARGRAYRCWCTPEELAGMRAEARARGRTALYDGRWRDRDPSEAPDGVDPVIRLRTPTDGETVINDRVQGRVAVRNDAIDDFVLLRADGTPTYMHSVVVDDHDMGITHVIRGDDHLNNAFRQLQLFRAMEWTEPEFAHVPLIHGSDGGRMSKRHGATAVNDYREQGFLPEALCNYLLRLGWSHGDDEIINREQAVSWFSLDGIGRSPARFDQKRLDAINARYLRAGDAGRLAGMVVEHLRRRPDLDLSEKALERVRRGIPGVAARARTVIELADGLAFYAARLPLTMSGKAARALDADGRGRVRELLATLEAAEDWSEPALEATVRAHAADHGLGLGAVAQPLRAALTGSHASPGLFEVLAILGPGEAGDRIRSACGTG